MHWLFAPWHWMQRRIDLRILWPICKEEAERAGLDITHAKAAFAYHCFQDYAWTCLGEDELKARIDALT